MRATGDQHLSEPDIARDGTSTPETAGSEKPPVTSKVKRISRIIGHGASNSRDGAIG